MRPLTDATPKPLLRVGGRAIIEWQVERLAAGGFDEIVVNHSHLGEQIERALGDGRRFGVSLRYSHEPRALETAGGIVQALALLGEAPFVVVSGDIHTDFEYASLRPRVAAIAGDPRGPLAHLVLVDNPPWHAAGDMGIDGARIRLEPPRYTYGNIGVFHPALFDAVTPGTWLKLFPWMYRFVDEGRVTGECFHGAWDNIGTPEQLAALDRRLRA